MKLRNKKTGEIGYPYFQTWKEITCVIVDENAIQIAEYTSLAELNEEWEDYEEPKGSALDLMILTLTNFIVNEPDEDKVNLEDCKQMLEKLKAWKRLKDKKFKFRKWRTADIGGDKYYFVIQAEADDADKADLELLFGGEE